MNATVNYLKEMFERMFCNVQIIETAATPDTEPYITMLINNDGSEVKLILTGDDLDEIVRLAKEADQIKQVGIRLQNHPQIQSS